MVFVERHLYANYLLCVVSNVLIRNRGEHCIVMKVAAHLHKIKLCVSCLGMFTIRGGINPFIAFDLKVKLLSNTFQLILEKLFPILSTRIVYSVISRVLL